MKIDPIKLYYLDDHQVLIDGIRAMLSDQKEINIIGTSTNGLLAIEYLKEMEMDVVLCDISMPIINGIEFTKKLLSQNSNAKVLALSMFDDAKNIMEMMNAGAKGYILKNSSKDEVVKAIKAVAKGENYFNEKVRETIINMPSQVLEIQENNIHLSPREVEVIQLIAKEFNNSQIATELFISERTVETHRKNIMRKTDCHNVIALLKFAIGRNLL